jgi:hypothetical protein
MIQTLVNRAICSCMPSRKQWVKAYKNDSELCLVRNMILNPSKICNESLSKVNHIYCMPLQQSLLLIDNGMLILKEPITGSNSYTRL